MSVGDRNVRHIADFVSELEAIRRQVADIDGAASTAMASPVVVHCSAGVGRTGVVILVAVMKASLERNQVCVGIHISFCLSL